MGTINVLQDTATQAALKDIEVQRNISGLRNPSFRGQSLLTPGSLIFFRDEKKGSRCEKRKEGLVQNNILGEINDWAIVFYLLQKNAAVIKFATMNNLGNSMEKGAKGVDGLLV